MRSIWMENFWDLESNDCSKAGSEDVLEEDKKKKKLIANIEKEMANRVPILKKPRRRDDF